MNKNKSKIAPFSEYYSFKCIVKLTILPERHRGVPDIRICFEELFAELFLPL